MADVGAKVLENVPGRYFVDVSCIDCDTCRCIGPEHFRRSDGNGYSYIFRQPVNRGEEEIVEEAMDCCPVEAIGRADS